MIAEMKTSMKKLENKFEELSQKVGRKRERDGKQKKNGQEMVRKVYQSMF